MSYISDLPKARVDAYDGHRKGAGSFLKSLTQESFFSVWTPRMLSVLRIVVAALFMQHGMAKLFHVPHVASFDNVQLMSLIGLAGVLEIGGGLLLLIGLFTRPVALVLSGEMTFAYF